MKDDAIAGLVFTIIAILLTWLVVRLIKNKLNNPESTTEWGGIAAAAFFAFIFILFSGVTWFGLFIQSKSIEIDADFIGVKPDTIRVEQDGEKIYRWRLECRGNDPISGTQLTLKSEPFEGTDLYYNRSKIKVFVYPDKADTFYEVDLSYITSNQGSGIKLITEKLIQEADRKHKLDQEKNQAYEKQQELGREKSRELTVLVNRIEFAGIILLILVALIVGGWLYLRQRALQNRIQQFTHNTEKEMQSRGWSFSFKPYERHWEGVVGMLKKEVEGPNPEGFIKISGSINETSWTLEVSVNRKSTRGYYRSVHDYWLRNTSYTGLKLATQTFRDDTFIALMEIPKSFPEKVRLALEKSQAEIDQNNLSDLASDDAWDLLHTYVTILFGKFTDNLYQFIQIHRSVETTLDTYFLTITNKPNKTDHMISQKIKSDLREIGQSEKGGYGILISRDGIMVSTLSVLLKPDEIQRMVDLGMLLKTKIEKMRSL